MDKEEYLNMIQKEIDDADMVLVGIGKEFSARFDMEVSDAARPFYESRFYEELPDDHEVILAYKKLRKMLGNKFFFAITTNVDGLIYRGDFEKERLVAPCGNMGKMQCGEHIVDAKEIRDQVIAEYEKNGIIADELMRCPECAEKLVFHTVEAENYLESGYLEQWKFYNTWLSCTLNRKLCVLELGVGFDYPSVMRFPFEKITYYNKKSRMIRVNSKFPQLTPDIAEKGISVAMSPLDLLR